MSTTATVLLVGAALGVGFYVGAKYVQGQVHGGAVAGIDQVLGFVGLNVNDGYGRVAHNLADTVVGQVLGG
jgi:hypothetical protein